MEEVERDLRRKWREINEKEEIKRSRKLGRGGIEEEKEKRSWRMEEE